MEQRCDDAAGTREGMKTAIATEGPGDQGRGHRVHEDLPRRRRGPRRPGVPQHGPRPAGWAHWEILAKLNETANDRDIAKIVKFALPLQQAHVDAVREHSVRLARPDPTESA